MKETNNFYTENQLNKVLEIPLYELKSMLAQYTYFKGLVELDGNICFADGYFLIEETEMEHYQFTREEIENDYHLTEPDTHDAVEVITSLTGTEFCNNRSLAKKTCRVKTRCELVEPLYSYDEVSKVATDIGLPLVGSKDEINKKEFLYDAVLVNQKSNFKLIEAVKIASNTYTVGGNSNPTPFEVPFPNELEQHNLELISDCIKGTNQHGFKLCTVELWTTNYDEFGDRYSSRYDNGTYLKQKAVLDYELTIITKREFVRWCEYQGLETGLVNSFKVFEPSYEQLESDYQKLKTENVELEEEIERLRAELIKEQNNVKVNSQTQQDVSNDKEILKLKLENKTLTEELDALKGNSFPVMTTYLKAALSAQRKYWVDYDIKHLPLQKNIQHHIQEQLNIKITQDNRVSKSLAVAIQPNEIKRK